MYQKRRLRTVVISGRGVRRLLGAVLVCVLTVGVSVLGIGVAKLPGCSTEVAEEIIKIGLNAEEVEKNEIVSSILGFDIADSKTILYKYYSQFGMIEPVVEAVESAPIEFKAEPAAEEPQMDIEEVNIAKGMALSNATNKKLLPEALAAEPLHIKLEKTAPEVLIVHTHTTESYTDAGKTKYSASDNDRTTDSDKNMIAIGRVMQEVLESHGIKTVHDTTVHDYPSYNGAYTRSMTTMKNNLKKTPTIKVVLDVHRDGIVRSDGTKVKVAADIGGEKTAQCMFVVGTDAKLKHSTWQDNMRFACKLQNYANINYPGLMRPINVRNERFNQQITSGSLIVEVGSNGNTLDEAKAGARYIAETIAAVLEQG